MKQLSKPAFIMLLSKGLSDFYGRKITFGEVQNQLMLIEMGMKPTDEVIAAWIKSYATIEKS